MTDSKNKHGLLDDDVYHPVIANPESTKTRESSSQRRKGVCLFRKRFLNFFYDPFCLILAYLLEISRNRLLEGDLISQSLSSYPQYSE